MHLCQVQEHFSVRKYQLLSFANISKQKQCVLMKAVNSSQWNNIPLKAA